MLTAEQRDARRAGIGGSDVAPILGISPWRTPLDIYLDKVDGEPPSDSANGAAFYWGHRLESVVADEYAQRTGRSLRRVHHTMRAKDHPFMLAHIDRQVLDGRTILECKTARDSRGWGPEGTDDVPIQYVAQCMHYMIVTGRDECDLAVLFLFDRDYRIYTIPFNPDIADQLIDVESRFWNRVEQRLPPLPTNPADARRLWSQDDASEVEASGEVMQAVHALRDVKSRINVLDEQAQTYTTTIMSHMQDASRLVEPDGDIVATWRTQTASRFDQRTFRTENPELWEQYKKPNTSRVFRLK